MLQHAIIHLHACTFVSVSIEKRIPRSFAIYSFRAGCVVVESSTLMRGERKVCVEDQQGILQRHPACYSPDDRWTRLAAGVAFVLSVSLGNQICQSKNHTKVKDQGKIATIGVRILINISGIMQAY
jgi:hypothetical protein